MQELYPNLYVGDIGDYDRSQHRAIVSATKTVHKELVISRGKGDPDYIAVFKPYHAILNWVDGPADLYDWSGPGLFSQVNDFIEENLKLGDVLVHCNAGLSRSPTVCMTFMAKRLGMGKGLFDQAVGEFEAIYPQWQPGGILDFVAAHWKEIR